MTEGTKHHARNAQDRSSRPNGPGAHPSYTQTALSPQNGAHCPACPGGSPTANAPATNASTDD